MTYWNKKGKYQERYDSLFKLIPIMGECVDPNLELIRVVSNAYYDLYNSGGGNRNRFEDLQKSLLIYKDKLLQHVKLPDFEKVSRFVSYACIEPEFEEDEDYFSYEEDYENRVRDILPYFEHLTDAAILVASAEQFSKE